MSISEVKVPDIGDFQDVEVLELMCKVGQSLDVEDPIITIESEKATMDVPSPLAGKIIKINVKTGDKVSEGDIILELETRGAPKRERQKLVKKEDQSFETKVSGSIYTKISADSSTVSDINCEVLVLGSGPGGYTAAFRAADLGLRVVLVERHEQIGGVCLNVGCIPSKSLLHAAKIIFEAQEIDAHGISFGKPTIDLDKLREWKNSTIRQLTGGLKSMAKQRNVKIINGFGEFTDSNNLTVTDKNDKISRINFSNAVIAAGSRPVKLPFLPEDPRIIDSTGSLELANIPKNLLVIGGGIIGLEMATVYHALGSKITIVEMLDGLMAGADRDLVRPFQKRITKQYNDILQKKQE